ncbi:RNA-directed DNA polymerase [Sinorhizobium meliloti]|uniref:RNA-directed DNA polymerase n=1 Tax=Rhizobium meliloti TaxID=382 RepID=UPI003D65B540
MKPLARSILRSLLGKGYFPKELPPVFTTADFGDHAEAVLADWEAAECFMIKKTKDFQKINGKPFRGKYGYKRLTYAEPEIISKPKKLYERRNIHITHPIPQALLAREIAENWRQLQRILSLRKYSEDEIVISDRYERSIKGINFPLHRAKKRYIEATADWLVKTDISRFYPSIYTHSLPWAAYGKENVKTSLKVYEGSFADRLDVLVRACNRNQTIGVPIGPETSRILAEIVSSRIDYQYSTALPKLSAKSVDRLQDDWLVGASTLEEAENILSVISSCYRDYGLEINGSKTSVTHILGSKAENWKSEISAFLSHRRGGLHGSRMEEFLSLCLRLQLASPSEPVMNYALGIVEGREYLKDDVQVLESFLLKAAAVSPASMDRICRIILNIEHKTGGLSRDRLVTRFSALAERHFSNGALYEVIWLLYTIRGLKKPFKASRVMECAENSHSSAVRLLLLDMCDKGICLSRPPVEKWESEVSEDRVLSDWSWLYAYEAIRKGWMADPKGILAKPFFKAMHDRDVVFYDPKRNVRNSKSIKREQAAVRKEQNSEVYALLSSLRGLGPDVDIDGVEPDADFDWIGY